MFLRPSWPCLHSTLYCVLYIHPAKTHTKISQPLTALRTARLQLCKIYEQQMQFSIKNSSDIVHNFTRKLFIVHNFTHKLFIHNDFF